MANLAEGIAYARDGQGACQRTFRHLVQVFEELHERQQVNDGENQRPRIFVVTMVATVLLTACLLLLASAAYAGITFTVNSTGDQGDSNLDDERCFTGIRRFGTEVCTLRAAIEQANATTGPDQIQFGILAFRDSGVMPLAVSAP
jgi:CSLREA domain-containing protein